MSDPRDNLVQFWIKCNATIKESDVEKDRTMPAYARGIHDIFINGIEVSRQGDTAFGTDMHSGFADYDLLMQPENEYVPELPVPRRSRPHANPFHFQSAELHRPADPHQPNLSRAEDYSDSERTDSVADEYRAAERVEREAAGIPDNTASPIRRPAKRKVIQISCSDPENLVWNESRNRQVAIYDMAGRGRGSGRPGPGGLKGVTWEYDATIKLESKPTDLFPPHPNLKRPAALTDRELREIGHYKRIQKEVHRGPLYTQPTKRDATAPAKTFGEDQFNRQYSTNPKADFDPFTGVETYSQAFQPKANELPKFGGRPFNKDLFPKELWPALEGKAGAEVRKTLSQAQAKKTGLMNSLSLNSTAKPGDRTKIVLEKMDSVIPDQEEEDEEDQEQAEEDNDDAFDDESMGGDYDAEQYFDNGEDQSEGEGGGGDEEF